MSNSVEEGWAPCSYLEPLKEGKEEDILISSLGKVLSSVA